MDFVCENIEALPKVAGQIMTEFPSPSVVMVSGPMGAGKTTLIAQLCKVLGSEDEISSPTFSLVNEYLRENGESIFHFDMYRIEDESEALDIGIEEYFMSGNFCFVEWPEKIPGQIPEDSRRLDIKVDSGKRIISLS